VLSFKEERDVEILLVDEPKSSQNENTNNVGNILISKEQNNGSEIEIDYVKLFGRKFASNQMIIDLNTWALPLKFKLIYLEGVKKTKDGYKRVLVALRTDAIIDYT